MRCFLKHTVVWPFLIFSVLWFIGFASFIVYSHTFHQKSFYPCDGFVVFTGFFDRITPGVQLFQRHMTKDPLPKLLLSGVDQGITAQDFSAFKDVTDKDALTQHVTFSLARNTIENALDTIVWAKKHNLKHVCLITNRYHVPRSLLELHHAQRMREKGTHPTLYPHVFEVYPLEHTKEWWKNINHLQFLCIEYHKYIIRFILTLFQRSQENFS
jgi:uncharacterized SAM-binding protein YcdF (DUF218 family)